MGSSNNPNTKSKSGQLKTCVLGKKQKTANQLAVFFYSHRIFSPRGGVCVAGGGYSGVFVIPNGWHDTMIQPAPPLRGPPRPGRGI